MTFERHQDHSYLIHGNMGKRGRKNTRKKVPGNMSEVMDISKKIPDIPRADYYMEYVYFLQACSGKNLIKIGRSVDPNTRVPAIQACSPDRLKLVGLMYGDRGSEAFFHRTFSEYRHHYEWFEPGDRLIKFLAFMKKREMYRMGMNEKKLIEKEFA